LTGHYRPSGRREKPWDRFNAPKADKGSPAFLSKDFSRSTEKMLMIGNIAKTVNVIKWIIVL
jgi:hypothetical protein